MSTIDEAVPLRSARPQLLTPRDTAKSLAISERTLWTLTRQGIIPAVRIGRSVRYDPRDLNEWIEKQKAVARCMSGG